MRFLDWTRGLAAIIMLQGHVFHSFIRPDLRESGPYVLSQFIGGITPAIFLFLTGVTLGFMLDGQERRGAPGSTRFKTALRRAGYLAVLAFAFRFQLWLFGQPHSPLSDLLKVDILNCMAAAIATMGAVAFLRTRQRVHAGILIGGLIAVLSPVVALIDPGSLPRFIRLYLVPDPNFFAYFPWASFVGFGIGAGSILRLVGQDQMHRVMQWAAILGFGLILSGQYFSNLPYSIYSSSDFWVNSPGLIFIKLGVILLVLAIAFLWTSHGAGDGWSWVRQLGTTSLLVYWVHIELVYGSLFGHWKESLTAAQCLAASLTLILVMVGLSYARTAGHLPELRLGTIMPTGDSRRVAGE
jgi:uncharacterized membrane protein